MSIMRKERNHLAAQLDEIKFDFKAALERESLQIQTTRDLMRAQEELVAVYLALESQVRRQSSLYKEATHC